MRVDAGIDAEQRAEAAQQQPGADEQHQCDGDLGDASASRVRRARGPGEPPRCAVLELLVQRAARSLQRGREAEGEPGRDRDEQT